MSSAGVAHQVLRDATLAWARADRDADDLAAKLEQAQNALDVYTKAATGGDVVNGVVRVIVGCDDPERQRLILARTAANDAFTAACEREHAADVAWKELAHAMLDYEDRVQAGAETHVDD